MAEATLECLGGSRIEAASADSHPNAVRVMRDC
nr:hypothetical protein [Pseudarthrobacter psychrotolerans]